MHTYYCKKDVTRILPVFRWDVRCSEDLDIIPNLVLPEWVVLLQDYW